MESPIKIFFLLTSNKIESIFEFKKYDIGNQEKSQCWGSWVAQLVEHMTWSWDHQFEPHIGDGVY